MVWMESITSSAGGSPVAQRGQDVAHRCRRRQPHRRLAKPEPDRAQPHLLGRFLARDIDDAAARARPARPRPAAAGSTCRCRDRRRPASPIPARSRRRSPGRTRRSRSAAARASATALSRPTSAIVRPPPWRLCLAAKMLVTSAPSWTSVFHSAQSAHAPASGADRPAGLAHIAGSSAWPCAQAYRNKQRTKSPKTPPRPCRPSSAAGPAGSAGRRSSGTGRGTPSTPSRRRGSPTNRRAACGSSACPSCS